MKEIYNRVRIKKYRWKKPDKENYFLRQGISNKIKVTASYYKLNFDYFIYLILPGIRISKAA